MHKIIRSFLRLWISLVSVIAFAVGWFFIAHAQKPAPLIVPQVQFNSPTESLLEPIPTINDLLNNDLSSPITLQNSIDFFPRLRTRGS
jgi:hypothetical protein